MASQYAALDLGSNSFHLVIAENRDGRLQILDKLKEMVRLAGTNTLRKAGWDIAIGASGTILAVHDVLQANGWSQHPITAAGLATLIDTLVQFKDTDSLSLEGLSADRRAVSPGGVAILAAVFEALTIDHMQVSSGALREGLSYLAIILRLSVLLHRNRTAQAQARINALAGPGRLNCIFPSGWFTDHPLTRLDLSQEADYLAAVPMQLRVTDSE